MNPTPSPLLFPPEIDDVDLARFTAPEPRAARIARPTLFEEPKRSRMPLWRFFARRGF
jgi:hypothetical protein